MSLRDEAQVLPPRRQEPLLPPGRMCPADYRYPPSALNRPADFATDLLYVVGGLYGNLAALDALADLLAAERGPATVVFNGDFHWFDAEPGWFAEIDARMHRHRAIRGNVESEIARLHDIGAGCGCAYPEGVDRDGVQRSNEILRALRASTAPLQGVRDRLAKLPMHLVAQVGPLKVGIVHGDAASLAGWRFAGEALDAASAQPWIEDVRRASCIDAFASTHTCLAALRDFALSAGRLTIINNGAAGMPNFAGSHFGVVSRIAAVPSVHDALFGVRHAGVSIEALALPYRSDIFLRRFLARWPEGSAANRSYLARIMCGPQYDIADARPRPG